MTIPITLNNQISFCIQFRGKAGKVQEGFSVVIYQIRPFQNESKFPTSVISLCAVCHLCKGVFSIILTLEYEAR